MLTDLMASDIIRRKVQDIVYAQHLYATLASHTFARVDNKEVKHYSSSRGAGGIVAQLRGTGDYLDWYCSGMIPFEDVITFAQYMCLSPSAQQWNDAAYFFIRDGHQSPEILNDIRALGWRCID